MEQALLLYVQDSLEILDVAPIQTLDNVIS